MDERESTTPVLHGIRVLDLTRFLPGGYCTLLLADLGAEVVKIEDPRHGDTARIPHPGFDPIGARHVLRNRAKKSVTLNLADPRGQDVLHALARRAHVLLEGFRPGVAARLGAGYDVVHAVNPALVYCSISGYGQDGPYRDLPGHDLNYMAYAGALSVMARGGVPSEPGLQVADITGGMLAAAGILAALVEAQRTGCGRCVDISMTDAVLSMLYLPYASHVGRMASAPAAPAGGPAARPAYGVYRAADGKYLTLGIANEPHFWRRLCGALGREDLSDDAYLSGAKQADARATLADLFVTRTRDAWFDLLREAGVPCAPVLDFDEITRDPHARARAMFLDNAAGVAVIGCPVKVSGHVPAPNTEAPALGEHTREILGEAGYRGDVIETLRAAGVV